MTRFFLTLMFSSASVAGVVLILYAVLVSRRNRESIGGDSIALGFDVSEGEPGAGIVDFDLGHEGLMHREKETFDPGKHKPEPIESRKKNS